MSVQAIGWALKQQEVTEPITRFVLVCLANYAGVDGDAIFVSLARLSLDSGLCERAIRIHIRKLEKASLLRRGNPAFAAAYIKRPDRRPTVYTLVMQRGASDAPRLPTGGMGVSNGGHVVQERGACGAPDPKDLSVGEPKSVFDEDFKKRFGTYPSAVPSPQRPKKRGRLQ